MPTKYETLPLLHGNPLDADPHLAVALGASFEVSALVLDRRHESPKRCNCWRRHANVARNLHRDAAAQKHQSS